MECFESCFQEIEKRRKETLTKLNQQQHLNPWDSQIKLIQQELQQLKSQKVEVQEKHETYLEAVQQIIKDNKENQMKLMSKEDRLYKIKTNLQYELLTWMPQVGTRHRKLLEQEQVDVKIRRHQQQREQKQGQQQNLKGVSNQSQLPPLSYNPSKIVIESPKKEEIDNESLAISKSFAQSQIKQSNQKISSNLLLVPQSMQPPPRQEFAQPKRGEKRSEMQYGDDEYYDDF